MSDAPAPGGVATSPSRVPAAAPGPAAPRRARTRGLTLFVSYSGLMGGSERILLDLAPRLSGGVAVACPEGPLAERLRAVGVHVFPLRRRRLELRATLRDRIEKPVRIAGQAREVGELVAALRPAVTVGWGTRAAISCAPAVHRANPSSQFLFQNNDLLRGPIIARIARTMAYQSDLLVALSAAIARDLDPHGTFDDRTVVVPPGVDLDAYAHIGPPPDGPPHALVLGALVGWKRPRLALEAVALAARRLPDLTLTVAGPAIDDAGERLDAALHSRAAEPDLAGRVTFTGELADPRPALAEATCLLHAADVEPYGMVVVEALAAGRAVVAPASGGPAEIVAPETGRLFMPGDPHSAADALVDLLAPDGLAARVGAAGRARAERHYRLEDSTARYDALLDELAERRRAGASIAVRSAVASDPPGTGLALVTVLHDSEPELRALLASVERHLPGARVIAADSGSSDAGPDAVRAWAGDAEMIDLGENLGFGRASNAALAAVDRPVTVLINPDAELLDDSLEALAAEVMRADRPERILAPLVMHPDGPREDSAHPEPGSAPELLRALIPPAALPRLLRAPIEPWRADEPRRVGWAVGCCLVARTDTLRRLGPFDDRAFLYAEDLDLGLRATDAGVETWFWPAGRVLHRRAHASSRVFGGEPFDLLALRRREVVRRWRGVRRQRTDDGAQALTFATRAVLKWALGGSAKREREQLAALRRARHKS
ncbi:MAG: N-acetylglucosaminyl-diphospho-decaprenol L-rhamnosyltransferase [Thermoleophilaceae bacterium]|nr:N-acetylglucosaminyl-diphospho-decaprenol L-rhamnosyltransferase [Thermoleophilaceae bacterium]